MQYLVDPRLVVDVLDAEPEWGERSARLFDRYRKSELFLTPVSYLSLAPAFLGRRTVQDEFLKCLGIAVLGPLSVEAFAAAYRAWCRYQANNPNEPGLGGECVSLYLGATALQFGGLLTRRGAFYRRYYPNLVIIEP